MLTQTQPLAHTITTALKLGPQQQIEQCLRNYFFRNFIEDKRKIEIFSQELDNNCYVCLENFVPSLLQTGTRGEVTELLNRISEKNSAADNTLLLNPKVSKVSQTDIEHESAIIPALYYSQSLRQLLSLITGNEVIPYSARDKGISITHINRADYCEDWKSIQQAYQLVWFIEAPRSGSGGALEFTTKFLENESIASTNKTTADYIQREYHKSGDAFLLKTDTCLHRFTPLVRDSEQVVVTMGFANGPRFESN